MELFNRLINEGVFVFWDDNKKSDSYIIKFFILVGEKKIELFSENILSNRHFYSIDKLGSGDYIIEINSFKNEKLIESVEKKIHMSSSIQNLTEINDSIKSVIQAINSIKFDTSSSDELLEIVKNPEYGAIDSRAWVDFIRYLRYESHY